MRTTRPVCLVLLLGRATILAYEEKDFKCWDKSSVVATTSVCDGVLDCLTPHGSDESPEICAPTFYLDQEVTLEVRNVTSTSIELSWPNTRRHEHRQPLTLAGYFLTGKSNRHSFQNTVSGRLLSYKVQWLKPWTQYTIILRPYYTESGKPHGTQKIGRAASADIRTLPSEPEAPVQVSVLSARQRTAVLNIVGPTAWNSDPVGFHVLWEAVGDSNGQRGGLEVQLPADWSPEENTINATLSLQGGGDYRLSVSAVGTDGAGAVLRGPGVEIETRMPFDSYEISAYPVDSSRAIISWLSPDAASLFLLTLYADVAEDDGRNYTVRQFDGTGKVNSRHSVVISSLQPWTYYVASIKGCLAENCSLPVNTTFVTPPLRPKITVEHGANMQSKDGTSLLRWTCVNGTVDYLQYSTTEAEEWSTCNNSAICDVTVDHGHTATLTTGFLRLTHGVTEGILMVWVRGCNSYGCGHESSVSVNLLYAGPSALTSLSITPFDRTGIIRWYASSLGRHDGIEITWKCNDKTKLVYHRRIWQEFRYGTEAHIEDWSRGVENCKFNVSAYMDDKDGTTHYSPPIEATPESS
ncbi:uncharacterized protein LOC144109413 isoform X2 [Amblyomma americanum]